MKVRENISYVFLLFIILPSVCFAQSGIAGDANGDGVVNSEDFSVVLQNYGLLMGKPIDQFSDGQINSLDFGIVMTNIIPTVQVPELGFTQQMWAATPSNIHLSDFERIVDEMAAQHQKWIRTAIPINEVILPGSTATTILWNIQNLQIFDQALAYAKSNGLKIILIAGTTGSYAKDYSISDFSSVTSQYLSFLSQRYNQDVAVWQIFNEPNTRDFRTYALLDPTNYPLDYLANLNFVLTSCRSAILANNPNAKIIVTSDDTTLGAVNNIVPFYMSIIDDLDILGVDIYPGGSDPSVLVQRINQLSQQFNKPVYVTETGKATASPSSEEIQKQYLPLYIRALKQSVAQVGLVYEYEDVSNFGSASTQEGSFGIEHEDGSTKTGYQTILMEMQ